MTDEPWRRAFDAARDPYAARNALGSPADGEITTAKIANDAVDNTKLANMAFGTVKGRVTAGTGDPEDIAAGQLPATATNDNASAGRKGEYSSGTQATPQTLTNNTALSVVSLSLAAGDWEARGSISFGGNAATTVNYLAVSIGTTVNALNSLPSDGYAALPFNAAAIFAGLTNPTMPAGPIRFSFASTTTVYITAQAGFGVSTCTAMGSLSCRRIR